MSDLRLVGPFSSSSGYSKMCRAVLSSAIKAGFKVQAVESDYYSKFTGMQDGRLTYSRVYVRPLKPLPECQREEVRKAKRTKIPLSAPTLFVQIPDSLEAWHEYSSGPRIGWTMCESDRLNERWKDALTSVDLLLAPSKFVLDVFRRDVPSVRSELVPLPVDDRLWQPAPEGTPFSRKNLPSFIFLSVFSTVERKNWRYMLQAFGEEFKGEDVGMIVRPSGWREVKQLGGWVNICHSQAGGNGMFVQTIEDHITDEQLADYYRMANCYVLPSAEGFGLPFVEAALCGTPSIALDGGGAADVVNEEIGYLIPHVMKPYIGQLPHCYPSDHLFPSCEFDALRKAMRRAYDDSASKGQAAMRYARSHFTPAAIAPAILAQVESSWADHKAKTRIWSLPTAPKYALVVGEGFGDAMASYGNALHALGNHDSDITFYHYGYSKGVKEWLEIQPRVSKVVQIVPKDKETFHKNANNAGGFYGRPIDVWLPKMTEDIQYTQSPKFYSEFALTHVHWPWGAWEVHRPESMNLTDEAEQWADAMKAEWGEFLLVQPYSISSVSISEHWYYWPPFLKWLIDRAAGSHTLVFAGQEPISGAQGEHVINMIGKTPTMQHVLALSKRAKGVISTCNALANWTAITGTPGLIALNAAIPNDYAYWGRFMQTPNNKLVPYDAGIDEMIAAAEKWLEARNK